MRRSIRSSWRCQKWTAENPGVADCLMSPSRIAVQHSFERPASAAGFKICCAASINNRTFIAKSVCEDAHSERFRTATFGGELVGRNRHYRASNRHDCPRIVERAACLPMMTEKSMLNWLFHRATRSGWPMTSSELALLRDVGIPLANDLSLAPR